MTASARTRAQRAQVFAIMEVRASALSTAES
jgi:hypothetical protein